MQVQDGLRRERAAVPSTTFETLKQYCAFTAGADAFFRFTVLLKAAKDLKISSLAIYGDGTSNVDGESAFNDDRKPFIVTITDENHFIWLNRDAHLFRACDFVAHECVVCNSAMCNVSSIYFKHEVLPMVPFDFTDALLFFNGKLWRGEALIFSFLIGTNAELVHDIVDFRLAIVPS